MIQQFGSALNLNPHFHILMLDGVYYQSTGGALRFKQGMPPTREQVEKITIQIAQRAAKLLERLGYLKRDDHDNPYLDQEPDLLGDLQSHSITYRVAVGPNRGQKVFQLQLLPPTEGEWITSSTCLSIKS